MADLNVFSPVSDHTIFLDEPPCCLEFVPLHPDHFVVGTYQLEKDSTEVEQLEKQAQTRHGQLYLFEVVDNTL